MPDKKSVGFRFRSALIALFLQVLIALVIFLPALYFDIRGKYSLAPLYLLFAQALLSAFVAYLLKLERWWVLISFFAPLLFIVSLHVNTNHWHYLVIFALFFAIYGATFHSRVPYFPSPDVIPDLLASLLPGAPFKFLDVGSGFGKVLLPLARRAPFASFCGVELAFLPLVISRVRANLCGRQNIEFVHGNFQNMDFSEFDIVYTYLSPVVMDAVWTKALAEMRHGTLFISYEFNVDGRKADFEIECVRERTFLYVWKM
ncbi:class I SAM-dependent methyltransferase [Undibacterium squillarum]|nr:class I SAM-dependent methyltransferase [Undibacterium squillarum]